MERPFYRQFLINPGFLFALALLLSMLADIQSFVEIDLFSSANAQSYIMSGLVYVAIIAIYIAWLLSGLASKPDHTTQLSFKTALFASSPFLLTSFISFPSTSDIYTYLHSGAMVLDGVNPYVTPASDAKSAFSPFLVWHQTSTYGPLSQLFFASAAAFSGLGPTFSVYVFKSICLVFHVSTAFLIWRKARGTAHQNLIGTAYLINPIVLFEFVKQAHVDALLSFTIVIAILTLLRKQYFLSNVFLLLGALCKTLPIIWIPLLWIYLLSHRLWRTLAACIVLIILAVSTLSLTALTTLKAWTSLLNPGVAWQSAGSLHNILDAVLYYGVYFLPADIAQKPYRVSIPFKALTYGAYVIYSLCLAARQGMKRQSVEQLVLDMGWAAIVLFLLATPWYQPWYSTILIPISAILLATQLDRPKKDFLVISFTYCLCSTSYYVLAIPNAPVIFSALVSMLTVVPSIAILIFVLLGKKRRTVSEPHTSQI